MGSGNDRRPAGGVRLTLLGPNRAIRGRLAASLGECGINVVHEDSLASYARHLDVAPACDVMLVDLEHATDKDMDALDQILESVDVPLMFSESSHRIANKSWLRRLAEKLVVSADVNHEPAAVAATAGEAAVRRRETRLGCPVWVLGASFGGPEAVKRFLGAIERAPDVVFVLAQHIGEGFAEVLAQQLHRSTVFDVTVAGEGMEMKSGHIYVAPVFHHLYIDEQDRFQLTEFTPQRVSYSPCIDDVMRQVAGRYGDRAGAVIFSGMGDDGTEGTCAMIEAGGVVWAQDPETCAIDSMPACARATGLVSHTAGPEKLAVDLVNHLNGEAAARQEVSKQG